MVRLALILLTAAVTSGGFSGAATADLAAGNAAFSAGNFSAAYVQWAPLAAEGDVGAQRGIGLLFDQGLGVTADPVAATRWFTLAAAQGDAEAQYRLGRLAAEGRAGQVSAVDAARWFRKAAVQGHGQAQASLGALYLRGFGVRKDSRQAARWFREAAENGVAAAQFGLADLYARGDGLEQDQAEAARWYRRADQGGHPGAARELAALDAAAAPAATPAPLVLGFDEPSTDVVTAPTTPRPIVGVNADKRDGVGPAPAQTPGSLDAILQEWAGDAPVTAADPPATGSPVPLRPAVLPATPTIVVPADAQFANLDNVAVVGTPVALPSAVTAEGTAIIDAVAPVEREPTDDFDALPFRATPEASPAEVPSVDVPPVDAAPLVAATDTELVQETATIAEPDEAPEETGVAATTDDFSGGAAGENFVAGVSSGPRSIPRPKPLVRPRRGTPFAALEVDVATRPEDLADTGKLTATTPTVTAAAITTTPEDVAASTSAGDGETGSPAFPTDGPSDEAFADGLAAYLREDYDAAITQWEVLADENNPFAELGMGWLFENGRGVAADPAIAVAFYRVAANQGVAEAHYRLSVMYREGRGVADDTREAQRRLDAAVTAGLALDPPPLPDPPLTLLDIAPSGGGWWARTLGAFDRDGTALNRAYAAFRDGENAAAVAIWRRLAEQAVPAAQFAMARAYAEGRGVAADDSRAVDWLNRAATAGHGPAMHNLGLRLTLGLGVEAAPDEATRWFERALARGIGESRLPVGLAYAKGVGARTDPQRALAMIAAAADNVGVGGGDVAQYSLAVLHAEGLIDNADPAIAVAHFRSAAAAGSTAAKAALGALTAAGHGTPADHDTAIELLTMAAQEGDRQAQYNLGVLASYGIEGAGDAAAGFSWLTVAAANGEQRAARLRALIEPRLSAADLTRAANLTAGFRGQQTAEKTL